MKKTRVNHRVRAVLEIAVEFNTFQPVRGTWIKTLITTALKQEGVTVNDLKVVRFMAVPVAGVPLDEIRLEEGA